MAHPAHYREAHPMPFVITHWINLIAIASLAFSGFYIHYPFFSGFMDVARGMHFFFMYTLIVNLIIRIVLAFFVKSATALGSREVDTDIKNWMPQKANRGQFWAWLRYYTFTKKEHPLSAKYGVLQKFAYLLTIPLTAFMAWTGFSLYGPYMDNSFFQQSVTMVGGPMNMRIIHYFAMWAFLIFTAFHAYLAFIEGTAGPKIIFARKESKGLEFDSEGKIIGGPR